MGEGLSGGDHRRETCLYRPNQETAEGDDDEDEKDWDTALTANSQI
jgi:hypothetical protein